MARIDKKALALAKSYAAGLDTTNDAVDALKADLLDLAPAYSAAATYAPGAYCTYSGNLYECTSAIAAPEAWTAGHWTVRTTGYVLAAQASQLAAKANYTVLTQAEYDALVAADALEAGTLYEITDSTEDPLSVDPIVVVNANVSPALGTIKHNYEYRCTGSVTTAPTLTLAAIAAASTVFAATVIYTAPDANAPVVTNNSGKTLKYQGSGVAAGTFTPVSASTYRMTFLWDGVYMNVYISGVA